MKKSIVIAALASLMTCPVMADVKIGEPAPTIAAGAWHNLPRGMDSLTSEHLKGQLVLVEFWATWCAPCRFGIPDLVQLQESYKRKGLVVIALSDEPDAMVGPYAAKHKMSYVVGAEARGTLDAFRVRAYPSAYLIDTEGKVAWKGHPADAKPAIEKLLKTKPPKPGCSLIETAAQIALKKADDLRKSGKLTEATAAYEKIVNDFEGTQAAGKARAYVRNRKTDPEITATSH